MTTIKDLIYGLNTLLEKGYIKEDDYMYITAPGSDTGGYLEGVAMPKVIVDPDKLYQRKMVMTIVSSEGIK